MDQPSAWPQRVPRGRRKRPRVGRLAVLAAVVVLLAGIGAAAATGASKTLGGLVSPAARSVTAGRVNAVTAHPVNALHQAAPASSSGCADVLFVGARGSGEQGPGTVNWPRGKAYPDNGLGSEVNEVYQGLKSAVGNQRSVALQPVDYPADSVELLLLHKPQYFTDLSTGVGWTLEQLATDVSLCPGEQIVLAGYSQGAMVMHRVLHQLAATGTGQQILSRVAGAVLIGDGDQVPDDNEVMDGSAASDATGIGQSFPALSGSSLIKFSPALGQRLIRVCNRFNIVCDNDSIFSLPTGITTHLHYTRSKALRQAITQLVAEVRTLAYTGGTLNVTGTVGTALSASAMVTGGVLPLTPFVGTDGTAPGSWLWLGMTGQVVTMEGIPTEPGTWAFNIVVEDAQENEVTIPVDLAVTSAGSGGGSGGTGSGSWTAAEAPQPPNGAQWWAGNGLTSVACTGPAACVSVGGDAGLDGTPLLLTGAGNSWSANLAPLPANVASSPDAELSSVACVSECVAVGSYADLSGDFEGLLVAGSGNSWTGIEAPLPTNAVASTAGGSPDISSVSCPSDTTCVAVGGYSGSDGNSDGLLLTGSGTSWTATEAPLPANAATTGDSVTLSAVTCPSASTCVAVGTYVDSSNVKQGLLLTWSGSSWQPTEAPLPTTAIGGGPASLTSVDCPSASACIAVGTFGDTGLILAGSGATWSATEAPLPANAGSGSELESVACATSSACVAVGRYSDSSGDFDGLLLTGSATSWTAAEAPVPGNAGGGLGVENVGTGLSAVACPSVSECVAVGAYPDTSGYLTGLLLTESQGSWTAAEAPLPANADSDPDAWADAVSCPSTSNCVAVGAYTNNAGVVDDGLLLAGPA